MQSNEPWSMASYHQQDLLAEAESERLLSMLPERPPLHLRHKLAVACYRVASWLDPSSASYLPPAELSGVRAARA
jgi:hypothetical protein